MGLWLLYETVQFSVVTFPRAGTVSYLTVYPLQDVHIVGTKLTMIIIPYMTLTL